MIIERIAYKHDSRKWMNVHAAGRLYKSEKKIITFEKFNVDVKDFGGC